MVWAISDIQQLNLHFFLRGDVRIRGRSNCQPFLGPLIGTHGCTFARPLRFRLPAAVKPSKGLASRKIEWRRHSAVPSATVRIVRLSDAMHALLKVRVHSGPNSRIKYNFLDRSFTPLRTELCPAIL